MSDDVMRLADDYAMATRDRATASEHDDVEYLETVAHQAKARAALVAALQQAETEAAGLKAQLAIWESNEPCPECGEDHKCGTQAALQQAETELRDSEAIGVRQSEAIAKLCEEKNDLRTALAASQQALREAEKVLADAIRPGGPTKAEERVYEIIHAATARVPPIGGSAGRRQGRETLMCRVCEKPCRRDGGEAECLMTDAEFIEALDALDRASGVLDLMEILHRSLKAPARRAEPEGTT